METRRSPGTRAGLTADAVLAAGRELVEREGVDALTMRRLAETLGVAPNTLYSYFPDKAALLDALLDSLLAEIDVPGLDADGLAGRPRGADGRLPTDAACARGPPPATVLAPDARPAGHAPGRGDAGASCARRDRGPCGSRCAPGAS